MKPSAFDYIRVDTLDEALSVLADRDLEAKILAGGQSLVPMLNMRLSRPKALVDVNRLAELAKISTQPHSGSDVGNGAHPNSALLEVGALVRQRQLERYTLEEPRARLIHTALIYIGHPQTRNQGTVGGSLVHADPSAELPLLFLTLGGTAILQSIRGERQVPVEKFFQTYFTTAIEPDEMLTKTLWRLPEPGEGISFKEYRRRHGDFALLVAACTLKIKNNRTVQHVQLGLGGVSDTPLLVDEAQELVGDHWTKERTRAIAEKTVNRLKFIDDYQASSSYRRQLATVLITHVLDAAYDDALIKEGHHAVDQS